MWLIVVCVFLWQIIFLLYSYKDYPEKPAAEEAKDEPSKDSKKHE